ncbi:polymeric immunoglobulin receptor-like isoform X2 [Notolabrus celidotus]|uniref:polymeric immunoglobulin receptor-like isoform X2 n=1 Tax=Notolabrus celidotus TaxID=1203425 RepID=UPI00148F7385|nr:polymeric immunoglobulin receptor-like isoform X2 [Notolabrus celidotus]
MAALLSALLIFTGLSGLQSITTVSEVSVKAGGSISVPCLYGAKYTNHVKYLCKGYEWISCSYAVKSKTTDSSGRFSISDDKQRRIFTVTITAQTPQTHNFWCAVEINNGEDIRAYFQLSVTNDQPQLSVDHQEVTGFSGESVSIHFRHRISGQISWHTLGGSFVKEPSGTIEGTTVTITQTSQTEFTVTLSGLRTHSSGWYLCAKGDFRMPVHVTVKERPSTTTLEATTFVNILSSTLQAVSHTHVNTLSSTLQAVSHTPVSENYTTVQTESQSCCRAFIPPQSLIISGTLLVLLWMLALILWFTWRRRKQTKAQPSAAAVAEEELTYSTVSHIRPPNDRGPAGSEDVIYSTVAQH